MKKISMRLILCFGILVGTLALPITKVMASSNQELDKKLTHEEATEIVEELIDEGIDPSYKTVLTNDKTGEEFYVDTYVIDNGEYSEALFSTEASPVEVKIGEEFVEVPKVPQITTFAAGDKGNSNWDPSISVSASVRCYYYSEPDGGLTKYLVYKVSGSINHQDKSVQITRREINAGTSSGWQGITQRQTWYPTGNSFTYNTGFAKYATAGNAGFSAGTNLWVGMKRGTSAWTLHVQAVL